MELTGTHVLSIVLLVSLAWLLLSARAGRSPYRLLVVARSRTRLLGLWVVICSGVLGLTTGLWALLSPLLPAPAVPAAVFATEALLLDLATQRVRISLTR
jgi:uncharacterized membrane protein HdeD (DUF308 family)